MSFQNIKECKYYEVLWLPVDMSIGRRNDFNEHGRTHEITYVPKESYVFSKFHSIPVLFFFSETAFNLKREI